MPGQINIPPAQPVDQGYREENPNSAMVATGWRTWLVRVYELLTGLTSSGTSAQRPTKNLWVGYQYFDTDLAQQIVWSGTVWVLGGGAPPAGGPNMAIQYNDTGLFGGDADFTWNKTTNVLTMGNVATSPLVTTTAGTANGSGALLFIQPGAANGTAAGAPLFLYAGEAGATGTFGGTAILTGGTGGATSGAGGDASVAGGFSPNGKGGGVSIEGGQGATDGAAVTIAGGNGTAGNPGEVSLAGGSTSGTNKTGARVYGLSGDGTGTGNGGDILWTSGGALGSGARGNIVLNGGGGAALPTTARGGFVLVPSCAGTPTGVPAAIFNGTIPVVFDTAEVALWAYTGTSWRPFHATAYGQLSVNISHFQTIDATWSPVTGYNTSLATPIDVVQNAAAGTLALTDTGTYLLTITAAIAFTSTNAGRSFQFRMFNVTDSVVAAGPLTIYVGRDIAGVNMAISTRFIAAASGKAMRIEMGNGDTFSAVQIQDMSYGVNRI